jgi:hypothetical protein
MIPFKLQLEAMKLPPGTEVLIITVPPSELQEAIIKAACRKILLDASTEVASHWNVQDTMVNQYEQAQRSAGILQRKALEL